MRFKILLLSSFPLLFVFYGHCQQGRVVFKDSSFVNEMLQHQNTYRRALQLPDLQWSSSLAADALTWAKHLAQIDRGEHDQDIVGKEGENLWWGTANSFSYGVMVDAWGNEKRMFRYGTFPDCRANRTAVVGHYTQMVWRNTQSVGCALVGNGRMDYLVCRYSAPGNIYGEKPY